MQSFNFLTALASATLTLVISESVKHFKEKYRRHKRRTVLCNYLSRVVKPGLIKYEADLEKAIQEIETYPPYTNLIEKPVYDILPWLNSKILNNQDLDELYELTLDGELHTDALVLANVIDYLKDFAPHTTITEFHKKCNEHYEEKGLKNLEYISHAKNCNVVHGFQSSSIRNLKGRYSALNASKECVDQIIIRLEKLKKRNWFYFYNI